MTLVPLIPAQAGIWDPPPQDPGLRREERVGMDQSVLVGRALGPFGCLPYMLRIRVSLPPGTGRFVSGGAFP